MSKKSCSTIFEKEMCEEMETNYQRALSPTSKIQQLSSKVPEVTIFFWVIKILATTVGETAADFLNINLHLGLAVTTFVMSGILLISLLLQFGVKKYVPGVYWFTVVMISIVGTLITDNLTDNLGVALETTTIFLLLRL